MDEAIAKLDALNNQAIPTFKGALYNFLSIESNPLYNNSCEYYLFQGTHKYHFTSVSGYIRQDETGTFVTGCVRWHLSSLLPTGIFVGFWLYLFIPQFNDQSSIAYFMLGTIPIIFLYSLAAYELIRLKKTIYIVLGK